MPFVIVAGGVPTAGASGTNRYGRVAVSLCAGAVCGAATFGIALLLQTTDAAMSSSGLGYYTDIWWPWWWLIVGLTTLALGLVAALGCRS